MGGRLVISGGIAAVVMFAFAPNIAIGQTPPPSLADCQIAAHEEWELHHIGEEVSLSGHFSWGMHYRVIYLEGCDHPLFVRPSADVWEKIRRFLEVTYPGVSFGGGEVWGRFTGIVARDDPTSIPYIQVTDIQIDDQKRMQITPPPK